MRDYDIKYSGDSTASIGEPGGSYGIWTGSDHYKTGGVEPIDLYKAGGMFRHFALCCIIKYAFRNRDKVNERDMDKIIHYAKMLKEGGE